MSESTLRVGKISYLNLFPIFASLERLVPSDRYRIVEGYPSMLNSMLRSGELDISPSSSIEYLRDKESYAYLKGHSISSKGRVRSILLFSTAPIEKMGEREVLATHQSETSVALLRIILEKFYSVKITLKVTDRPFFEAISGNSPYLSIGDDALLTFSKGIELKDERPPDCQHVRQINGRPFYVYDLGELWYRNTGLPSVFALWTYRADMTGEKMNLLQEFSRELNKARELAMKELESLAGETGMDMPESDIAAFWKGITYTLDDDCLRGLRLFEDYARQLGLI